MHTTGAFPLPVTSDALAHQDAVGAAASGSWHTAQAPDPTQDTATATALIAGRRMATTAPAGGRRGGPNRR